MEAKSAAAAANLAENLPDGTACIVTVGIAAGVVREEKHLADLLIRICLARTGRIVTDL